MPGAGSRSSGARASSKSALVEAALDEFSEKGYEAATVAGIAERAGVTTGALYAHFDGKLGLLLAAIDLASPSEYARKLEETFSMPSATAAEHLRQDMAERPDRRMVLLLDVIVLARRDPEVAATLRRGLDAYLATMTRATEDGIVAGWFDPAMGAPDLARLGAAFSLGLLVLEALGEEAPSAPAMVQLTDALLRAHRADPADDEPAALARVRDRAEGAARAKTSLYIAIADAAAAGLSLRRIGEAAGLSHELVRRIVRDAHR